MKRIIIFAVAMVAITAVSAQEPTLYEKTIGRLERAQMGPDAYQGLQERRAVSAARRQKKLDQMYGQAKDLAAKPGQYLERAKMAHQGGEENYRRRQAEQAELRKLYPRIQGDDSAWLNEKAQNAVQVGDYVMQGAQNMGTKLGEAFRQPSSNKSYFVRQATQRSYDQAYAPEDRMKKAAEFRRFKREDANAYTGLEEPRASRRSLEYDSAYAPREEISPNYLKSLSDQFIEMPQSRITDNMAAGYEQWKPSAELPEMRGTFEGAGNKSSWWPTMRGIKKAFGYDTPRAKDYTEAYIPREATDNLYEQNKTSEVLKYDMPSEVKASNKIMTQEPQRTFSNKFSPRYRVPKVNLSGKRGQEIPVDAYELYKTSEVY